MPERDELLPLRISLEVLLLEQEMAVERALRRALKVWLPAARSAVLGGSAIVAAGPDDPPVPDPSAIVGTTKLWASLTEDGTKPVLGAIFDTGAAAAAPVLVNLQLVPVQQMRSAYLQELQSTITGMPARVWDQLSTYLGTALNQGTTIPAVRAAFAKILTYAGMRNDVTMMARTEATAAYNAGQYNAWLYADDLTGDQTDKVWIATRDTRTRLTHRHADEERVPLRSFFVVGTTPMLFPGDPTAPPGERINCRCAMISLRVGEPFPDVNRREWPALTAAAVFHLPGEHDQKSHGRRGLPELDLDVDGIPVGFEVGGLAGKAGWPDDRSKLAEVAQAAHRAGFDEARFDGQVGSGHMAVNPKEPRVLLMSEFERWDDEWFTRAAQHPAPFGPDQTFWMPQSRSSTQAGYLIDHESGHSVAFENGQHAADYPRLKDTVAAVAAELGVRVYGPIVIDQTDGVLQYKRGGGEGRPLTAEDVGSSWPTMEVTRAFADLGMSWKVSQGPAEMYAEMWAAWLGGSEARVVHAVAEAEGWTR